MELLSPENMLIELESNLLSVVLIPAPYQKHSGHCIRAVESQNAVWYQKFCERFPSSRKGKTRTRIKRAMTIRALNDLIAGKPGGIYAERLREFIKIENDKIRHRKRAARTLDKSNGFPKLDGIAIEF